MFTLSFTLGVGLKCAEQYLSMVGRLFSVFWLEPRSFTHSSNSCSQNRKVHADNLTPGHILSLRMIESR